MVMMEAAEAQVLLDHQITPLYTSDQGPLDPHVLEKRVLEEQVLEDELTHLEQISHPPVVNQVTQIFLILEYFLEIFLISKMTFLIQQGKYCVQIKVSQVISWVLMFLDDMCCF